MQLLVAQYVRYVSSYVAACDLCLRTKTQCQLPVGELQPLLTPNNRWETVSIDFIVELPESGGYDAVMVIVDSAGSAHTLRDDYYCHGGRHC